ncbi:MAG: FMN-binding negative transcriptional regulator [Flavobacteriaceae bacterium]|nr:FMN-binding negative transcriptional regulator [Bacteroidia bacterium]NND12157.1 FMN-binding negative transcriptional regulator [Flavobacteriaceae bacterium]NNL61515.1 FMN-binding negative transcriptional regulator [Flavobacteriaceae bacterium]RZV69064.1 MAG: FMN-binding negative transcriptional regulator [Flavobacteriaceae bacterium]
MYNFSYFKEKDKQVLLRFLNDYPFAFLTGSNSAGQQVATQVPILIEEREGDWYLQGHIMRKTDHHKAFLENDQILAVFTGPHAYVSATWYTDQQMGSTWNYMSVHLKGRIRFLPEEDLIAFMKNLTLKFENNNSDSPTIYDNLPDDYLNKMLPAISAFEIKVEEMENVFKLSQNRDEESYRNIIAHLEEQRGISALVATEMRNRLNELFNK